MSARLFRKHDRRMLDAYLIFSGVAIFVAAVAGLSAVGWTAWTQQAPLLILIPIAYLIVARLWADPDVGRMLHRIAQATIAVIFLHAIAPGWAVVAAALQPEFHDTTNLLLALVFAETAIFYLLAAISYRRDDHVYMATAAACAAMWQVLGYVGIAA